VLVSRTTADVVAGSGLELRPYAVVSLRGVPGDWPLFTCVVTCVGERAGSITTHHNSGG
jgi:hypothetical protein